MKLIKRSGGMICAVMSGLSLLVLAVPVNAQIIIHVDDDATLGANNGTSWDDAFLYLQDALTVAAPGDEIRVAQGTYKPDKELHIQELLRTPGWRNAQYYCWWLPECGRVQWWHNKRIRRWQVPLRKQPHRYQLYV